MSQLSEYIKDYRDNRYGISMIFNPLYRIKLTHMIGVAILILNALLLTENTYATLIQLAVALVIFLHDFDDRYLKRSLSEKIKELEELSNELQVKVKEKTEHLEKRNVEIEKAHKSMQDSISFASQIQQALLPKNVPFNSHIKDFFSFWQPRDTVGGDIFLFSELKSEKEILVMVIDGAGHGVPGAFVTMLVKAIEAQIVAELDKGCFPPEPSEILRYFNRQIKTMLKQVDRRSSRSNAGFDGGVIYYNRETNVCKYAGAKTPLYIVKDDDIEIIKSDRKHVGFVRTDLEERYTCYDIEITKGTKLYLSTDGLLDQEGDGDSKFGKRNFESFIRDNYSQPLREQKEMIVDKFHRFKSNNKQNDDITVVGIEFVS